MRVKVRRAAGGLCPYLTRAEGWTRCLACCNGRETGGALSCAAGGRGRYIPDTRLSGYEAAGKRLSYLPDGDRRANRG